MNKNPEKFYSVSNTQLSVARFSGGCIFNGDRYVYIEADDTLIRSDIFELDRKAQKKRMESEKAKWKEIQKQAEDKVKQCTMEF